MKLAMIFLFLVILSPLKGFSSGDIGCISHRALGYGELENSLSAINAALDSKVEAIEFDVRHTRDGVSIIYHDEKIERDIKDGDCKKGAFVKDTDFFEISKKCLLTNGENIPTLSKALNLAINYESKLFIEFKDLILEKDLKRIKETFFKRPNDIYIISFKREILDLVEERSKADPFFQRVKTLFLEKSASSLKTIAMYDGSSSKKISASKVRRFQQHGKLVAVWTKNSKREIKRFIKKDVDYITTNDPILCQKLVQRK